MDFPALSAELSARFPAEIGLFLANSGRAREG
jgi:hypothetical protein